MNIWFYVLVGVVVAVVAAKIAQAHLAARKPPRLGKHARELANEAGEPTLPEREIVEAYLFDRFPDQATALLAQYDRLVKAMTAQSYLSEELAAAFSDKIGGAPLGDNLCDLVAYSQGRIDACDVRRWECPPREQRAAA